MSTASPTFGNLRSLLQQPASAARWEELCHMCDGWVASTDEAHWEELIAYTQGALRAWPVELCVAPERWIEALFAGRACPQLRIVRAVDTRGEDVGDEQIFELTSSPTLTHLESLGIGYNHRVGWRPERLDYGCVRELCTCPQLSTLRTLRLTGQHLLPDSFTSLLTQDNVFHRLETLDFSFNALNFLKTSDLLGITPHPLKSLRLCGTNLNSQGLAALATMPILQELELLDLSSNPSLLGSDLYDLFGEPSRPYLLLKTLNLGGLDLEPGWLTQIFDRLDAPHLATLDLSYMRFNGPHNADEVLHVLAHRQLIGVRSLILHGNTLFRDHDEDWFVKHWSQRAYTPAHISLRHDAPDASHMGWLATMYQDGVRHIDCSHSAMDVSAVHELLTTLTTRPLTDHCTLTLDHTLIDPDSEDSHALITLAAQLSLTLDITAYHPPAPTYEDDYYEDVWEG